MLLRPLLAALVCAAPAIAQLDFTPLADVNQTPEPLSAFLEPESTFDGYPITPYPESFYWDHPRVGVEFAGITVFYARTKDHGDEVWTTDGTAAGTQLLADIHPGVGDSYPRGFVELDGLLYFGADDGVHGRELWVTDGTPAGTQLVVDAFAGPLGLLDDVDAVGIFLQERERLVVHGGKLYFRGRQPGTGSELWTSDGTAAGTQLVKDIRPGAANGSPYAMTSTSLGLMFGANDGSTGFEPYLSDGTAAGTQRIRDVFPGPTDGFLNGFTDLGGLVLFGGRVGGSGGDVFRTDGTAAGTFVLAPPALGFGSDPDLQNAAVLGGFAYFRADGPTVGFELFRSDGTEAGTTLVADLRPGSFGSFPGGFTPVSGGLVFTTSSSSGASLRHIDAAATITDLGLFSTTSRLQASGGLVFATLFGDPTSDLVVRTDGTPAGTDYAQVPAGATTKGWIAPLPGQAVMFAAHTDALGTEPYAVDGTAASAQLLAEVNAGSTTGGAEPRHLAVVGPRSLYFTADDGGGMGVHRWDPIGGLQELVDAAALPPATSVNVPIGQYTPLWTGSELLVVFAAGGFQNNATEVWATDGTPGGTTKLIDPVSLPGLSGVRDLVASGNRLYFTAIVDPGAARRLFVTDGTIAGTVVIAQFSEGGTQLLFEDPSELTPYADGVVFATGDGDVLYSDGTVAGTLRLHTKTGSFNAPQGFTVARNQVAFFIEAPGVIPYQWQLWAADLSGATKLKDFNAQVNGYAVPHLAHIGPDLYFYTRMNKVVSIYRTDLTTAGTVVAQVKQDVSPPVRAASRHIGTVPHVLFDQGGSGVAAFNGAVWTELPAENLVPFETVEPGSSVVFAGGGYLQLQSASAVRAAIDLGDFVTPVVEFWKSDNLEQLGTTLTTISDLWVLDGDLIVVLDDQAAVGEEVYRSSLDAAYVRDLDVTGNRYTLELSDPILGGPARLSGLGAPAGAPQLVFAGGLLSKPLPVGGVEPTTPIWLSPTNLLPITTQVGPAWTLVTTVPGGPALVGATLGLQAGYIDPQSGLVHASNALEIGIGLGL